MKAVIMGLMVAILLGAVEVVETVTALL